MYVDKEIKKRVKRIVYAAQLAAVFEVCTEKPGNVTPTHDFSDTTYEDFLRGSIAIGSAVEEAALRGYKAGGGEIPVSEIGVGGLILEGVYDLKKAHSGGNTHIGTLMLIIPIASAAGMCIPDSNFDRLRGNIKKIVEESTIKDSKEFYKAVETAGVGGLGELIKKEVSFHELMKFSADRDRIAGELINGMETVFEVGVLEFEKRFSETENMREAVLHTYLLLLSMYPDTYIAKKFGEETSEDVSSKAREVLEGRTAVEEFDGELRIKGLNPGTTADLVAAVLMLRFIGNLSVDA
ncbi:MAG: triphosphoribosyl-dephospho-CoA synthase [Candidatus Altiarchaeota archaeon]|nr:triphosphoribosyl-dephospho-CoA synthase [Candidatus Altiarchaeota archaeon]